MAAGCGTATFIVQQYDGPARPREQVAVLRLNGKDPVRVESLDGERLDYQLKDKDTRVHIELLPGVHELAVTDSFGLAEPLKFLAVPGHVYRPIPSPVYHPGSASFALYEVDANTDEPQTTVPPAPDAKVVSRRAQPSAGSQSTAAPASAVPALPSSSVSSAAVSSSAAPSAAVSSSAAPTINLPGQGS
jgi:hypothetical protein